MADLGGDASASFRCRNCQTPIALRSDLLSKRFLAKSGAAFMFSHARNIMEGAKQDRQLMTGVFCVADIYCTNCGQELGWKYIQAYEPCQKSKEGKFVIEKAKILKQY
ncbi:protein yippee-like At4g27740 [Prosopis cineraria]|uniref:protein yippee-like At4g27740 n=1 Tax=Prosopis cineraria TaxID=364024 RepID=UPI00240FCC6B|nr:protein yippee-like At4g27740 [Prosopis cineraria]